MCIHNSDERLCIFVGIHYRLQLNAYKYMLEKYYDVRVSAMYVVCTHPENETAFVDSVPDMSAEISMLMALQRDRARENRCMSEEDVLMCDPLGGADTLDDADIRCIANGLRH